MNGFPVSEMEFTTERRETWLARRIERILGPMMRRILKWCTQRWRDVRHARPFLIAYLPTAIALLGCHSTNSRNANDHEVDYKEHTRRAIHEVVQQRPDPDTSLPTSDSAVDTPAPRTLASDLPEDDESQYWNLSLQEAINYGLMNSRVLNDLGGTVLRNPDSIPTNMMSSIVQSDPRFGIEGTLSAYDARFNFRNSLENNDTAFNNLFLSGGNNGRTFTQQLNTTTTEIVKQTVTGGQLAARNVTIYDKNTAPSNLFPYSWTTFYEAEARQSLLQGSGLNFNRIAGPNGLPGFYNGVVIARIRSDISQAEFEVALRDYLSNVANAYCDLHFAYRDLASKVDLRDLALEVYGLYKSRIDSGVNSDEAYRLAQVREQYYRFQEDVENALTGRRVDGTRTNNGTIPGTFRSGSGVYLAERRLRLLIGVPTSDSRLIRPSDEATRVNMVHDWEVVKTEALMRRPELQRQKFQIKKAEMELVASRNYLKPRLDVVGRYRVRGFGEDLLGYGADTSSSNPVDRFNNAYGNLATGQFQESQIGLEYSMPIGYRQGCAAVAHAELRVARERAVLFEQERQVIHDVGNAVADLVRSYTVTQTAWERRRAASEYLEGLTNKIRLRDFGSVHLEQWLEAQRRFAEADTQYHLALCEHQIALKNVNYEKGSLLEYCNVRPIEGVASDSEPNMSPQSTLSSKTTGRSSVRTVSHTKQSDASHAPAGDSQDVESRVKNTSID